MPAEDGFWYGPGHTGNNNEEGRLQARMDLDLSDVITIGIETTLNLNWPKPMSAVLPVALAVSIVRFSGTLAVSFIPSSSPPPTAPSSPSATARHPPSSDPDRPSTSGSNPTTPHRPTTLAFTFLDDYRLDLSVRSLVGSRSRLQDVPKIAQLIESRVHAWFDERAVEPRFQQIVLPSLWPRKHNTRGGATTEDVAAADNNDDDDEGIHLGQDSDTDDNDPTLTAGLRPFAPSPATLEERIEAEGAKMRDAEIRAGVRKAGTQHEHTSKNNTSTTTGRSSSTQPRDDTLDNMRRRANERGAAPDSAPARRPRPANRLSGLLDSIPGAMPR